MSYNGWSNYETWRVYLECVDGMTLDDLGAKSYDDQARIQEILENMCDEIILGQAKGFALDLARSFLSEVNWREIADHMINEEFSEEEEC